jgi:hypothetical protein
MIFSEPLHTFPDHAVSGMSIATKALHHGVKRYSA